MLQSPERWESIPSRGKGVVKRDLENDLDE